MAEAVFRLTDRPGIALRLAVTSTPQVADLARAQGMEVLAVPEGGPQSDSLLLGLRHLRRARTARLLVLLGDMPFLRRDDIDRLLAFAGDDAACAQSAGQPMPPALFPATWFDRLETLQGDRGAGSLLRDIPKANRLDLPPAVLRDIDRPDDLTP